MTTIVAAGVIYRDGKVLLTKRLSKGHLADMWELPGGKLEPGESPEEALAREMREECGVEVEVGEALDVTFWRYPKKNVLLLFYRTTITGGAVQHLGVEDHAWVTRDALDGYTFPPADVGVLTRLRALLAEAEARA